MKRTAILVAIVLAGICPVLVALAPLRALANSSSPLKTSLSVAEIQSLQTGIFSGIPRYPNSELNPDLAAYMPNSFAMLGFLSRQGTVYGLANYYKRELPSLGWSLVDIYGISKIEYRKAGAATLTFQKGEQVLTLDITHRTRRLLQYTLFAYVLGKDPGWRP